MTLKVREPGPVHCTEAGIGRKESAVDMNWPSRHLDSDVLGRIHLHRLQQS